MKNNIIEIAKVLNVGWDRIEDLDRNIKMVAKKNNQFSSEELIEGILDSITTIIAEEVKKERVDGQKIKEDIKESQKGIVGYFQLRGLRDEIKTLDWVEVVNFLKGNRLILEKFVLF